jgi:hypothetical protein
MRLLAALSSVLLLAGISTVNAQTSTRMPGPATTISCQACSRNDTSVVEFAYALQNLTNRFYTRTELNSTLFQKAPNNTDADWLVNFKGMKRQSQLGLLAIRRQGALCPAFTPPMCNYTIPKPRDVNMFLRLAYKMESSVTGAFVGLTAYTNSPEVSFLVSRLAATHATHAAYLETFLQEPVFNATNATLIQAYPPARVLTAGNKPGMLGDWMRGCVKPPFKPCGESLIVGPVSGNLTSNSSLISSAWSWATPTATG